jgi:photosystem II stability/assembly factor-like uncharacterized protein
MRRLRFFLTGLFLVCAGLYPAAGETKTDKEPAFLENFYDVKISGSLVWVVGYYGTILHSADRGTSWEIQPSGTRNALFRAHFLSEKLGWVSGSYGTILHTRDGGRSWTPQSSGTKEHLFAIHFGSETRGWAVGSRGTILATSDGGRTWETQSLGEDVILNNVAFIGPKRGWIVGEFGVIYHTGDGGKSWAKQKSPIEVTLVSGSSSNLFGLIFPDSAQGWAFGLDGVVLRTRNGESWEITQKSNAGAKVVTVHHLFDTARFDHTLWAVGERGTAIFSPLGRDQWQRAQLGAPPLNLNGVDFGLDGFGLIVGNRGLILKTADGGTRWTRLKILPGVPGKGTARTP